MSALVALCESAYGRHDPPARLGERQRAVAPEEPPKLAEPAQVAADEAAVSSARPPADDLRLEHGDADPRIALLERERRPESGVPAADDRDVHIEVADRRRRLGDVALPGERLVQPPGRKRGTRNSEHERRD